MTLRDILDGEIIKLYQLEGREVITGVSCNSKEVRDGDLFFAMKGFQRDGSEFISEAMKLGAVACVVDELKNQNFPQVVVHDINRAFGISCAKIFNEPSKDLTIIGVTGTNGKTTITYMIESVLREAGISTGIIGTTGYRYCGKNIPAELTTPDAKRLNHLLSEMVNHNVRVVVMEVSSHALELGRVWGIDFDVAVFTNLTRDHLDFHKTMDEYFKSKNKLFSLYLPLSRKEKIFAVINNDSPYGRRIEINDTKIRKITYGIEEDSEVRAIKIKLGSAYSDVIVLVNKERFSLRVNLPGRHNVSNALACFAVCHALGIRPEDIMTGIENLFTVPGRLEPVRNKKGIRIFIDYAHTPDALENVLLALKETGEKRLITIFGCGGDRDRGKREIMGEIAGRYSDITIITSDNPRTEDPNAIIEQIETGIVKKGVPKISSESELRNTTKGYITLTDRKEAIELGLRIASRNDTVLIAGKGHEDYQIIGTERIHFSDKEVVEGFFMVKNRDAVRAQD